MSLVSLPSITENQFASYLTANITGTYAKTTPEGTVTAQYSIAKGFTIDAYTLPLVVVKAGRFQELEPNTSVFEGLLSITVITQVDDTVSDPVGIHDSTVGEVYGLFTDSTAVATAVNADNFHLWNIYTVSYDQEVTDSENKRALVSILEFTVNCQTLATG